MNSGFLGTFRRFLTEKERIDFYQETVKTFIEKIKVSEEIKEQMKNWASEKMQVILIHYDEGSVSATKYLSKTLENQKEYFQLEELQKLLQELVKSGDQAIQKNFVIKTPGFFEGIANSLNIHLDPVTLDFLLKFGDVLLGSLAVGFVCYNFIYDEKSVGRIIVGINAKLIGVDSNNVLSILWSTLLSVTGALSSVALNDPAILSKIKIGWDIFNENQNLAPKEDIQVISENLNENIQKQGKNETVDDSRDPSL